MANTATGSGVKNRAMITATVMLATLMQALDATIANVVLPYMQGSLSATSDQINWVLDLLYRGGRDHHAGNRLARSEVRPQTAISDVGDRLHRDLDALRHRGLARADGRLPAAPGHLRRAARAAVAIRAARRLSSRAAGPGDGGVRARHEGRSSARHSAAGSQTRTAGAGCSTSTCHFGVLCALGILLFLGRRADWPLAGRLDWLGFATLSLGIGALQLFLDRGERLD